MLVSIWLQKKKKKKTHCINSRSPSLRICTISCRSECQYNCNVEWTNRLGRVLRVEGFCKWSFSFNLYCALLINVLLALCPSGSHSSTRLGSFCVGSSLDRTQRYRSASNCISSGTLNCPAICCIPPRLPHFKSRRDDCKGSFGTFFAFNDFIRNRQISNCRPG